MTTVVLHIGAAKCGSSAIQHHLANNLARMGQIGIGVPGKNLDAESEVTGELIWFFENLGEREDRLGILRRRFARLLARSETSGHSHLVVSAENICNHPDYAVLLREALPGIDTKVVFYVRRQDDYFISAWQQWNLKRFNSLDDYLSLRVGLDARWLATIAPWIEHFGLESVIVRPFRRDLLVGNDVVSDFFCSIGFGEADTGPLGGTVNSSFDENLAEMAHRIRDVFRDAHDNEFFEVMVRLMGKPALKKGGASQVLTLEQRQSIYDRYRDENEELKRLCLPELGEHPLFEPPVSEDVSEPSDIERLKAENAILMRGLYLLAKKIDTKPS